MASFDVKSLFTNIPLDETIEIICNRNRNRSFVIPFSFQWRIYQQVDGVAMRSPLGPLFANIFLSFHEGCWLDNCPTGFKPLFYRRYVDDCFLIFQSADHIPQFLSYFNQQHPNINFTCEVESNSTLYFLDISIMRTGGRFETSVYQKPTFKGLYTNFHSFIPSQYKLSLIFSLSRRFFNIRSSYDNFHAQLDKFRMIFNRNGYPTRIFDRCVRAFLDKTFHPKKLVHSGPTKIIYFCLPYTGTHSLQIRTQVSSLCSSAFPHLQIRIVLRRTQRLSYFFSFKDKIFKGLKSCVVYYFKCRCCSASYVGQTVRHLNTRVSEHLGISALTGKESGSPKLTSILQHLNNTGHTASLDDFKILFSCPSSDELIIRESLLISKLKPSLFLL